MTTLSTLAELGIMVPGIEITSTSLRVTREATDSDYLHLEQILNTVAGSVLYWWGDYLNHLRSARGVEYAEAKAASSYSASALKNAAWVCRHVSQERRYTFSHDAEVAHLSPTDQEIWLTRAREERWSVRELRAEIRKSKAVVTNGPEQSPEDQRAARASASFEEFSMWYQNESPGFSHHQREEWNQSLRPLVADYLTNATEDDVRALLNARELLTNV